MKTYAALLVLTLSIYGTHAQDKTPQDRMSLEQRNELHLKKMAIDLDLNENQQKEMAKLLVEQSNYRDALHKQRLAQKESGKKMTADERFKIKSEALDRLKEHKEKMRKLLNEKQFAKWEANQQQRQHEMRKKRHERQHNRKEKETK